MKQEIDGIFSKLIGVNKKFSPHEIITTIENLHDKNALLNLKSSVLAAKEKHTQRM